jgi:hypothetical protein
MRGRHPLPIALQHCALPCGATIALISSLARHRQPKAPHGMPPLCRDSVGGKVFIVTIVLKVLVSVFDIVILQRWNVTRLGISDQVRSPCSADGPCSPSREQ